MLRPDTRNLLLETLRPPPGYSLDHAVGTTFALDLLALLTAPLAFTFFDWEDEEGRPTADPLALLEALRRHASRISLFCQAGEIAVPPPDKPLLSYLEESVVEVRAPRKGGLFHPKVWALRFMSEGEPVLYRVLCLSRNLTFARSWDTALSLEGELTGRTNAIARNHPLGEFFEALPAMALRDLSDSVVQRLQQVAHEIRRVDFQLPDGFQDMALWHQGLPSSRWPFPDGNRELLAMAPFMQGGFLRRLAEHGTVRTVISRPEALARMEDREVLLGVEECFVLSPFADLDGQDGIEERAPEDDRATTPELLSDDEVAELAGLHAKLFVMDDGWNARVWTGSANATEAAFDRNVEMIVELRGRKKLCGIEALLGRDEGERTIRALLRPFEPADEPDPKEPEEEELKELETRVRALCQDLCDLPLRSAVETCGDDEFALRILKALDHEPLSIPDEMEVRLWPVTLPEHRAITLESLASEELASFEPISMGAITAFCAFQVEARSGQHTTRARFVVRLPLLGAPANRRERILRDLLSDPEQVLRLLLLLLSEGGMTVSEFIDAGRPPDGERASFMGFDQATLLESLLKALDRNPAAIDDAERLIRDLRKTEEGEGLLPEGFDQIWPAILECRRELGRAEAGDTG